MYTLQKQISIAQKSNTYFAMIFGVNSLCECEFGSPFSHFPTQENFEVDLKNFQNWLQHDALPEYQVLKGIKSLWFGFDFINMDVESWDGGHNIAIAGTSNTDNYNGAVFCAPGSDFLSYPLKNWYNNSPQSEQEAVLKIGWPTYIALLLKKSQHYLSNYDILIGPHAGEPKIKLFKNK